MESAPSGLKLGGRKLIQSQGWKIIFSVYPFMKLEAEQEIRESPFRTDMGSGEGLYCYQES
jgi:hypothetical protein